MIVVNFLKSFKSKLNSNLNSTDKRAKIQDIDFIFGLIQAVARQKENFSLADIRLSTCHFLGELIGRSSFNSRLGTKSLVTQLTFVLSLIMTKIQECQAIEGRDQVAKKLGVEAIIGIDSSMVSLWDGLSKHFKGTFMTASVKLHMAINLVSGAVSWFDVTEGAVHDSQRFPEIFSGILYIFDLGYWSQELFSEIKGKSAFYLSRVKSNAKFTVTEVVYGIGSSIVGCDLLDFQIQNKRANIIELMVSAMVNNKKVSYRIIGFWNKQNRSYHWYTTNLSCSRTVIYELYRLRWQVELSFKSMKSTLNFDRIPTLNSNAVKSFVIIALINYCFTVLTKMTAEKVACNKTKFASIQKSAKIFSEVVSDLFQYLKLKCRFSSNRMECLSQKILKLLNEVFDPNFKKRKTSKDAVLAA